MKIVIQGPPIPAARPRVTNSHAYNPKQREKIDASYIIKQQFRKEPLTTPLEISLFFFMPIPNKMSIVKKRNIVGKPHTKKPDIDNLIKWVLDCANEIIYKDDKQVYEIVAQKTYSEKPRTEVIIEEYING